MLRFCCKFYFFRLCHYSHSAFLRRFQAKMNLIVPDTASAFHRLDNASAHPGGQEEVVTDHRALAAATAEGSVSPVTQDLLNTKAVLFVKLCWLTC